MHRRFRSHIGRCSNRAEPQMQFVFAEQDCSYVNWLTMSAHHCRLDGRA